MYATQLNMYKAKEEEGIDLKREQKNEGDDTRSETQKKRTADKQRTKRGAMNSNTAGKDRERAKRDDAGY